jgi:hypothetical protein
MIIGLYIGLAIAGILALIRGRMQISKTKVVVGIPARLLGLLAFTPFPVALVVGMIYVAANADVTDPKAVQEFTQAHQGALTGIELICAIGVAILLFAIASMVAVSPDEAERRTRRPTSYDDYLDDYDDRPRGRRGESENDFPRRRRPSGRREDEDDRPRRPRDDLDERAR